MRFPQSLLDRAEELVDEISEEAMNEFVNTSINADKTKSKGKPDSSRNMNQTYEQSMNQTVLSTEISAVEREVFDLFSHITLFMNDVENGSENNQTVDIETVNEKVAGLVEMMSPQFLDIVNKSTMDEIIAALSDSTHENSTTHNGTS
jgi:hypothetical protein